MLTTSRLAFKKPQTSDPRTALRTAISDNADLADALLDTRAYAEVLTDQTTTSNTPVDLTTPGPQITLIVPDTKARVEILAEVLISPSALTGMYVDLYEDGVLKGPILATTGADAGGRATAPGTTAGINAFYLGGPVSFATTAGTHVYKLMYRNQGGATVTGAKNRKIWGRVRTF